MHIAFLTTEYPLEGSGAYGGIATSMKNLALGLKEYNCEITIFLISQRGDRIFEDQGIHVHCIKQRNYPMLSWLIYRKYVQRYINQKITELGIDLIEAPDWSGISALMNFKCPLVIRFHGTDAYFCHLDGRKQKAKNFWLEKTALKNADYLVSVSKFTKIRTREIFGLKNEIKVIHNSVDLDKFLPDHGSEVPNQVLYFGTLIRKKGVLDLMSIFNIVLEKNPDARLKIAGADAIDVFTGKSTRKMMENALSTQGQLAVDFLGKLNYDEMKKEIAQATVIVLPSFAEALPMTWIESMAMEKAMVTSDIGWAKEVMIDGETGFTVTPNDHEKFAIKVDKLLLNHNLRRRMGKAARHRVQKKFSQETVIQQNMEFYQKIIHG